MICESGLSKNEELIEMKKLGFDGFLIGESLMKSGNLKETLGKLSTDAHG
jgi:indole-3-glycerol phosphate synthase